MAPEHLGLRNAHMCVYKNQDGEAGSAAGATHKHTDATTFGLVLCAHVSVIVEVTCRRGVRCWCRLIAAGLEG